MYTDAHLHLADYVDCCTAHNEPCKQSGLSVSVCCSAHTLQEFERHRKLIQNGMVPAAASAETSCQSSCKRALFSFGIHPQNPVIDSEADALYRLLKAKRIDAIGECGFDLFTDEYKQTLPAQREVWNIQVQLAQTFQAPLIVHCRKALPLIFEAAPQLKKIPAVIFHGWGGNVQEASAFLKRGVNAYFSIGKAVLRGQKSVCAMAAEFDITRLLTETDAPYMRLKHEQFTHPDDIAAVAARCAELRGIPMHTCGDATPPAASEALLKFLERIAANFFHAFRVDTYGK